MLRHPSLVPSVSMQQGEESVPVVAAGLLLHNLLQLLPEHLLEDVIDADEVHLAPHDEDTLQLLVLGSQTFDTVKYLLRVEGRGFIQNIH